MSQIHAVITGVGGYVPEYVLDNHELSTMMDTSDEWITTRVGIKERRILKEPGVGTSYMAAKAAEDLFAKTGTKPEEIDLIIVGTTTPDYVFPSCASMIAERLGIKNALAFDLQAACSGFIVSLTNAASFIETGRFKKALVFGAEKMSSITNYTDRTTAPLFGDGAGVVLVEPGSSEFGVMDSILRTDGIGGTHLMLKAGGSAKPASHDSVDNHEHTVYQEGQFVFKHAVTNMAGVSAELMEKNNLTGEDISWLIPHQANLRIIDATVQRTGVDNSKVMINIDRFGNTSAASIPLCMWESQKKFKKGDNIILTAFGAGFTWGAVWLKWAY
ncbi:MAG: 3-oxoacyl-(acyl-carrier-protein) synthase [Bacteroidetes bacterium]|jgi:3-oxoacyl-[acyl-carrier-protein] synthase-3|nr:3-oxoacyl-(acyl-carrier-protein) synthase [Bacteroidota bacterium]